VKIALVNVLSSVVWLVLVLVLQTVTCYAASSVTLQWDPNSESDLDGYKIYYKSTSATPPFDWTIAAGGVGRLVNSTIITGLDAGLDYSFAATAINTIGLESDYSNIVHVAESIPPTLTLTTATARTILTTHTLTGTVSDNLPGVTVTVTVGTASPAAATLVGSAANTAIPWSFTATGLSAGSNDITVTATDAAGNTSPVSGTITVYHAGVVNVDGTIGIADALQSLHFVLGLSTPTPEQFTRSDVAPIDMTSTPHQPKPDGKLDIDDIIVMLRRAAGLPW
jgi:hypothetical protein